MYVRVVHGHPIHEVEVKFPTSNVGRFFFYFLVQFISYGLIVANGRAYVQGSYVWTGITDSLIALLNYVVLRKIMKDAGEDLHGPSLAGYVLGGTSGSLVFIWLTKLVYGA